MGKYQEGLLQLQIQLLFNNMKKYNHNIILKALTVVFVLILSNQIFISLAKAADLEITCSQKDCLRSNNKPLFNLDDGLWYPGKFVSKLILLKNSNQTKQEIAILGTQKRQKNNMEEILYMTLANNKLNRIIWEGSLEKFYSKKSISLGNLKSGESLEVNAILRMNKNASLDYQNQKMTFDLTFTFMGDQAKDKPDRKNSGVLGQTTDRMNESWISKLFIGFQILLLRIISIFRF